MRESALFKKDKEEGNPFPKFVKFNSHDSVPNDIPVRFTVT